jgi:hypothetical protein
VPKIGKNDQMFSEYSGLFHAAARWTHPKGYSLLDLKWAFPSDVVTFLYLFIIFLFC